jgi:hypothetical protein
MLRYIYMANVRAYLQKRYIAALFHNKYTIKRTFYIMHTMYRTHIQYMYFRVTKLVVFTEKGTWP